MSTTRRAITQARFNSLNSKLVGLEFVIVGLIVGAMTSSFSIGAGVFLALSVGLMVPLVGPLILVVFTVLWAVLFFSIGYDAGGIFGSIVIGLFGSFMALGLHMSGISGILESAP